MPRYSQSVSQSYLMSPTSFKVRGGTKRGLPDNRWSRSSTCAFRHPHAIALLQGQKPGTVMARPAVVAPTALRMEREEESEASE